MRRPVDLPYSVTTYFGVPDSNALYGLHSGYDYAVAVGSAIHATTDGVIISTINHPTRGQMVTLYDGKYYHRFLHNSRFNVSAGQTVKEGDVIAFSGGAAGAFGSGLSTGPHCHWDMNTRGVDTNSFADFVDPDDWLKGRIPAAKAPAPAIPATVQPYERIVRPSESVWYRTAPNTGAAIFKTDGDPDGLFEAGEVIPFKGWVYGENVGGNNIWFVGRRTGGFSWSGAYTNPGTDGLEDLNPKPAPPTTPTPTPTVPAPVDLTDKVIDISSHNEVENYDVVKKTVRAVIAKAGHTGKSFGGIQPLNSDPYFARHKQNFGDKLVGAYWYGYPSLNPETEANAFLSTVGQVPDTFSYWLDIEEEDGQSKDAINNFCVKFLDVVEKATGRKCGLYMNRNWFNNFITDATRGERPIWLAHYGTDYMSNPVKNQVAHQYTSDGTVEGFQAGDRVDLNAVTDAFFITAPTKPEPTPETPDTPDDPVIVAPTPEPGKPDVITQVKTVAVNAAVTFVQTFIATWAATGFAADKVVLAGAVGAAGSLVWNTILKPFAISKGWLKQ